MVGNGGTSSPLFPKDGLSDSCKFDEKKILGGGAFSKRSEAGFVCSRSDLLTTYSTVKVCLLCCDVMFL